MRRLLPRSLLAQAAWLTVAAIVLGQVASFWLFSTERGAAIRQDQRQAAIERTVQLAGILEALPAAQQAALIRAMSTRGQSFSVTDAPALPEGAGTTVTGWPGGREREVLHSHDGHGPPTDHPGFTDYLLAQGIAPADLTLALPLPDGRWLNATTLLERPGGRLPPQTFGSNLVTLVLLLVALWLGLRRITRPLRALSTAADAFGLDSEPPVLPTDGPREVRALAEALARMHARLTQMVGERTRMLAALSHDLRSPLTALKLRAEMVDDDETRERMIASLDEMQEMTEATLAFARGVSADAPAEPVDLPALLAGLGEELSAIGPEVRIDAGTPCTLTLRRVAIRRALRNLMENAQRYGGGAMVRLTVRGGEAVIEIDDTGPGIPEADLERVFDPFERLETARSRETGGTGLGLPIARAILRAHGGDATLANRPEGGLRASVRLPLPARSQARP